MAVMVGLYRVGFIVTLFLAGCVTPGLVQPGTAITSTMGYRFKIPEGEWIRATRLDDQAYVFGKKPTDVGSTVLLEVRDGIAVTSHARKLSAKEILEVIQKDMIAESNSGRMNSIKNKFNQVKYKGADCLEFEQLSEDHGVKSKKGQTMLMTFNGRLCLHPKIANTYVRVLMSQRIPAGGHLQDLTAAETQLFDSLEFE